MADVSNVKSGVGGTRVQQVRARDGSVAYTLVDEAYRPVQPLHDWLRFLKSSGRAGNTLRLYATALHLFWDWCAATGTDWQKLTLEDLGRFATWLEFPSPTLAPGVVDISPVTRARSESTVRDYLGPVYRFYEHQVRNGLPAPFPFWDGMQHGYKTDIITVGQRFARRPVDRRTKKRLPKTLTVEQCREVIDAQDRWRDKFLFTLLATTGIRIGTALGLRHEDIRPWDRSLHVVRRENANGAYVKRSGGRTQREPMPKPLTGPAVRLHSEYMFEEYGDLDSDYVFVNLWGGQTGSPLAYQAVAQLVRRTRARVGFHFTPHAFRHTFATLLLEAGMPADRVALLLDHASATTTADIYSHISAKVIREQMHELGLIDGPLSLIGAA